MDSPTVDVSYDVETAYSMRGGLLFTQAAIVLLTGLLLPIPPVAIDILLAVNLVFTAMLLFVAIAAREPADITSLPPVVVFITLLRLGTNVAAAKSILLIANGGHIINWCGIRIYYGLTSIVIAALLVFLICVIICKAAFFIRRKAVSYLTETIPNRQTSLDLEFQTGTITYDQMLRARERIKKQVKFFAGMASTSSLLLCDGIIALIITLATILGATVIGVLNTSAITVGSQQYAPFALAIALTTAVPAVLVALALRVLISKRFLLSLKVQSPAVKTIHPEESEEPDEIAPYQEENPAAAIMAVPAYETAEPLPSPDEMPSLIVTEDADSIPPQTLDPITIDETLFEQTAEFEAEEPFVEEAVGSTTSPDNDEIGIETSIESSLEQRKEMEPLLPVVDDIALQPAESQTTRDDDDYYYSILATVGDKNKATILLAGENVSQLPITIAVELVIRIIQFGKKCLLVDMDPSRNAVAMAFDIDSASMQGKAVPTGITNLWISPADDPENPTAIKLSRKVANALRMLDYVVMYAPNAADKNIQNQLAGIADATILFGMNEETASLKQFSKTLLLWGCKTVFEQDLLKKNA